MDEDIEGLKRLIHSQIATIAKLRNQIKRKNTKEERKKNLNEFKKNKLEKTSVDEAIIPSNEDDKNSDPNYELKHFFISTLIENLEHSKYKHEYSDEIYEICFALFSICQHSYELLRCVLQLSSISSIRSHFSDRISNEKDNLIDYSNIPEIVAKYRDVNSIREQFDIILRVDACSFDRLNANGKKYCFCFYAQPIIPGLKSFPVHITPTETGSCSDSIIDLLYQIIEILKECDINVIYTASDGDPGYNTLNDKTFEVLSKISVFNRFESALFLWGKNTSIKHISDMLHILKLARKRLIQGEISLYYDKILHIINSDTIEKVLHRGKCLTDKSPLAKMKDIYALELFNFQNLEILFENNMIYEALYFLPYVCWLESVLYLNLTTKARIELLHISFDIFYSFYNLNETKPRAPGITINKSSHSCAQIFADSNLIKRSFNSIIGTAFIIINYKEIALDRIGTHVLENYFGQIRYSCDEFDSWENILSAISYGNIRTQILNKYNIQLPIYNRSNYGGIHIITNSDESKLSNIPSSLFPIVSIQSTFFQKLQLIKNINKEKTDNNYEIIKDSFMEFIENTKEDKKKFYNPVPVSSSRIFSRCICEKSNVIEKEEKTRNSKVEKVLRNIEDFYQKNGQFETPGDFNVVETIVSSVRFLNETLKLRTKELIDRSNFMSTIMEYIGPEDDNEEYLMNFVNYQIVHPEMMRRTIADMKFANSIREFINSQTLSLLYNIKTGNLCLRLEPQVLFDLIKIVDIIMFKICKSKEINLTPNERRECDIFFSYCH